MKLRHVFSLSSLMLIGSIGCCHHRQCVSTDVCNPCGDIEQHSCECGSKCGKKGSSWKIRTHNRKYGWNDIGCDCGHCESALGYSDIFDGGGCGCSTCGGGEMMSSPPSTFAGGSGCACGQHHSEYAPGIPSSPSPSNSGAPTPVPAPMNSPAAEPSPAPAATEGSTTFYNRAGSQPQHVSVEEFHRLPGVVTSGPGAGSSVPSLSSVPTSTPQVQASLPPLSTTAPQSTSTAQQASWTAVKR